MKDELITSVEKITIKPKNYFFSSSLVQEMKCSFKSNVSPTTREYSHSMIIHDKFVYRFKVILLGDVAVGKTAIIGKFIHNKFEKEHNCSVGVEFKLKSLLIDDKSAADLQIWDTCGQEKYKTITRNYYRDSNGCILVFDLTSRKTFEGIQNWIKDLEDYGPELVQMIIVGNKSDLSEQRQVTFNEAIEFARGKGLDYIEVSALNGDNIKMCFEVLSIHMSRVREELELMMNKSKTEKKKKPRKVSLHSNDIDYANRNPFDTETQSITNHKANLSSSKKKHSSCCK